MSDERSGDLTRRMTRKLHRICPTTTANISTDIAAADFGREFLVRNERGRDVIATMLSTLSNTRPTQCARIKK